MLDTNVKSRLEATTIDTKTPTRLNIRLIIVWINLEYGSWNDARGTRNYDEMKLIQNFTSTESTTEGLRRMKVLTEERTEWRDPRQIYPDSFYKQWLILRMKDWPPLSYERNVMIGDDTMTFAESVIRLLRVVKQLQEESYMVKSRHFTTESEADRHMNIEPNIAMDSISLNFQGSAVQQPSYPRNLQSGNGVSCFNCGTLGHAMYQCREPWCSSCQQTWNSISDPRYHQMSKCPAKYPERRTTNAPRPSVPMLQPSTLGAKRTFQQLSPATMQPRKLPYTPRPARPQCPPRGTAPRPMRTATVTATQPSYEDEIDYNDIQSLRAFAIRAQYSQQNYEQESQPNNEDDSTPEDADWNPEIQS